MNKTLIAILAFVMLSQAEAQNAQMGYQGDAMVEQVPAQTIPARRQRGTVIYDERTNEMVEVAPQVAQAEVQPQQQATQGQTNPIYILNNQKYQGYAGASNQNSQGQVQEQPTMIVQDSPLRASQAEAARRQRQNAESGTEDGIVQALERARMEDEMRRRDRFNNAITGTPEPAPTYHHAPPPPVQQVVTVPVVAPVEKEDDVDIKNEIRAALRERDDVYDNKQTYYVSGLVGFSKYPDVVNIRGNMSGGFALGMTTPERVVAEGTFLYSTYELEDVMAGSTPYGYSPIIYDMRQYNIGAAVKYQLLPGKLRPVVGGLLNYTRRSYSFGGFDFRTSDALDAGVVAGLDLQLTDNLALGFDFRYLMNIGYSHNTENRGSFVYQRQNGDVEKLDYYTGSLTGKFTF